MPSDSLPPRDDVLSAAARLQEIVPHAVLVGGTAAAALRSFDALYPQPGGASALQQLAIQLATPQPFDLEGTNLSEYKSLDPRWHDWSAVRTVLAELAARVLDEILDPAAEQS